MKNYDLKPILLVILISIFLQTLFVNAERIDTPNKAVIEFTKAYFGMNQAKMSERLCESRKISNDINIVDEYVKNAANNAKNRGFSLWYIKDKLYHIKTQTIHQDDTKAQIHITAERKPPLKSFFTKESYQPVDQIINVIKEGDAWKVCGTLFGLPGK